MSLSYLHWQQAMVVTMSGKRGGQVKKAGSSDAVCLPQQVRGEVKETTQACTKGR